MSSWLWWRFLLLVAWVTCCRWSWWDMLWIWILSMITLTMSSYWVNLFSRIFSWKLLSVAEEICESILLSCCWVFHADVFDLIVGWSWIASFFSGGLFYSLLGTLPDWDLFLCDWSCILALTWRLVNWSRILDE
jgi:hypothetical protein